MTMLYVIRCMLALVVAVLSTASFAADTTAPTTLRKQFLDTFTKVKIGQDVSKLALPSGWTAKALNQVITAQSGNWAVGIEGGTTVFRIYPYYDKSEEGQLRGSSCVVLKVNRPFVTVEQMIEAFEGQRKGESLNVVEYSVHYSDGKTVHNPNSKNDEGESGRGDRIAPAPPPTPPGTRLPPGGSNQTR